MTHTIAMGGTLCSHNNRSLCYDAIDVCDRPVSAVVLARIGMQAPTFVWVSDHERVSELEHL